MTGHVDPHSTGEFMETSLQRIDIGPTRRCVVQLASTFQGFGDGRSRPGSCEDSQFSDGGSRA
jgi:hypothetical protein